MTVIKEELENSKELCTCENTARVRYSWANGSTHIRYLCGTCQSVLELALSMQGCCTDFDCNKCRSKHV